MKQQDERQKKQPLLGIWDDKKEWKNEIYSMWQQIFGDPEEFAQYYYKEMYAKNRVYTIWEEEMESEQFQENQEVSIQQVDAKKLCGMIHLNPYQTKVQEEEMEIDYIVGVAVDETMRRRGIMRKMLQATMKEMQRKKMPFTFLMPANEAYYTPFDFRFVEDRFLWEVEFQESLFEDKFEFMPYEGSGEEKDLACFCDDFWKEFEIAPIRTKQYWQQMKEELAAEQGEILLLKKEEQMCGYLTYAMEEDIPVVRELVTKEPVREIIQDFTKKKNCSRIKVYLDWFQNFQQQSCEQDGKIKSESIKTIPTIMFRILDVEAMLTKFRGKNEGSLIFRLVDEFLPDNTGVYRWTVTKTNAILERVDQEEQVSQTFTMAQLTEKLFGYETYREQMVQEEEPFFENLIPLSKIYISEIV